MARKPKAEKENVVFSLKITLRHTKPPIWRRLMAPSNMTLEDLHEAIQASMGWTGGHLHAFEIDGRQYGDPSLVDEAADEKRRTLGAVAATGVGRFLYTYDFGDDWEHVVTIEKTLPAVEGKAYPACVAGKRAGPPEDCGGPWGYQETLEILANPAHPERAERLEWLGEEIDPEDFSVEEADRRLGARFGRK